MIEFSAMKRVLKWSFGIFFGLALVLTVAVPFVLPPLVQSVAEKKLAELGFPSSVSMTLDYIWRHGPAIDAFLCLSVKDTPWKATARFEGGFTDWSARLHLPKTRFDEKDPLLAKVLKEHPVEAVSNLVFSGSIALDACAEGTREMPVPVWNVKVPIEIESLCLMAKDTPVNCTGLSLTPAASGIARHLDIEPLRIRAREVSSATLVLTDLFASVRATEKSVLVTEAGAGFCGGKVSLYSLFLNPENLNLGLTLFLDDIDAGQALSLFKGFHGDASGRLHGKMRLFLKEGGKAVRLSDAFLYSTPGEVGKLQMTEAGVVTENLALAGIDAATRQNVSDALTDLDYSVLKLDLRRGPEKTATLQIRLNGTATRDDLSVPVDLNLNFTGELEHLVNTGLGLSEKLKGKSK